MSSPGLAVADSDGGDVLEEPSEAAATGTTPSSATLSTDVNQQKIHELEQDLSADQRQSQQQAQAQKDNATGPVTGNTSSAPPMARLLLRSCHPRPSHRAIPSQTRKRRWPSKPASRRISSPASASLARPHLLLRPLAASGTSSANNQPAPSSVACFAHTDADAKRPRQK